MRCCAKAMGGVSVYQLGCVLEAVNSCKDSESWQNSRDFEEVSAVGKINAVMHTQMGVLKLSWDVPFG